MGDNKSKAPLPKPEEPKKVEPQETKAQEGGAQEQGLDFAALDSSFEMAEHAQAAVMDRRAIAVREVLNNLNEADSPSVTDQILTNLAVTALGFATGGISMAIANKTVLAEAVSITNAVQTALDDGMKAAIGAVQAKMNEGGSSKATFFAGQEEGLVGMKQASVDKISHEKLTAKTKVKSASKDTQANVMSEQTKGADQFRAAANATGETARQLQYQSSLGKWMNAMSQTALGAGPDGTKLGKAVDTSPTSHYKQQGEQGVIYVAFGQHPASRPFAVDGSRNTIKVTGMTSAARDRVKNTPIKDLGMAIVATGYIYDGFFDGLSVSVGDNEAGLGKNEGGHIWWKGHDDAAAGLRKAANKTDTISAATVILNEDIGMLTLANAHVG
jgi:hypothetical protein